MNDDDDNLLTDYDLSAWDAPPPPAGLADAVIERARRPAADVLAPPPTARKAIRWWVAGGVAAVLVAAMAAIALWGIERAPADGHGEISANAPRVLDLGTSSATIDAGASVRWTRKSTRITATQSRGAATWRVGDDDTIVIDAGAMVASVEASGASLRVEVDMNRSDIRAVGISAGTAIAVAMVTVIVYEGQVRVTSSGQTVNVAPGATMTFPREETPSLTVGAAPTLDEQRKALDVELERIAEMQAEIDRLNAEVVAQRADKTVDKRDEKKNFDFSNLDNEPAPSSCDEVSCVLNNYDGACCTKYKKTDRVPQKVGATCDEVSCIMDGADRACCAKYQKDKKAVAYATCDAAALKAKGEDHLQTGMDAAALAAFEQSLKCTQDPIVVRLAFMAACKSKQAAKAKYYFSKIPTNQQPNLAQLCVRNGITLDPDADDNKPAKSACTAAEAAALKDKGEDYLQTGMDAAALAQFEKSLACKEDMGVHRLAFLAACRSKQAAKAKYYFPKLPASQQANLANICVRSGIAVTADDTSTPPACDATVLKQKGEDHLQTGMDAAALAAFEQSLACKQDMGVIRLAYLAACRSKQGAKAKLYYPKLPRSQQSQLSQICERSGIDPVTGANAPAPPRKAGPCQPADQVDPFDSRPVCAVGGGTLVIDSTPLGAKIYLDGVDTGETTPTRLTGISAGKHRITYLVGGDKFTFTVTVKSGETTRLTKSL